MNTEDIKTLREETGVSVMDIKKALEEASGDKEKARELLKERGAKVAAKKVERQIHAGRIEAYIHGEGHVGVLVTLGCETDFVAKNDEFKQLAKDLAMQVAAMDPEDGEALLAQQFIKDPSMTVKERMEQAIGKLGENISITRFTRTEI